MINTGGSMEANSWNTSNLHPKYSQVSRPEGKASIKGISVTLLMSIFVLFEMKEVAEQWEENSRLRRMLESREQASRVQDQCWLNELKNKLVVAGQNVIEAQSVAPALHSRELKRSTSSHLWNYSSLQIKVKEHVITQAAQARAWPSRSIWRSEERGAENLQTWDRSPERESEIIYQSSRCGLEAWAKEKSPTIWYFLSIQED